ncbi:restriction endonuclease subunit S [Helicobacter pylori]|nr:restriction endonuclease subunit S [Helicobacter pylori]
MKTIILKHHKIYCRFDIQKRHINHKGEFVITAGLSNNGVLGQSDIKAKVFESHTITIDMFGCAFYRSFPYKMVTHARVFSLKPKFEINHKIGLFLSTLFFGYPKKFGYENMCSWAKIKNDKVILPLKPTANAQTLEDIDFDFMEKFIAELEQCRLAELDAYLKATGLENTTLSNAEENALNVFNNSGGGNTPCGLTWQSFRLGDLFEMERGTRLTKANRIKGTRPLVTAGYENYGVAEYISNHDQKVFKGNTITIDMFANAFYRYSEYSADDNILVLTPKFTMSYRIGLCVTARINAVLKAKFSYGKQYRQKDFNVTIISLPANTQSLDGIDFHFMHTLINALMKQIIQGVAQYCDAKIQATKEAISQETPIQKDSLF